MKIEELDGIFTVCKIKNYSDIETDDDIFFIGKTDEEISLVCHTGCTPENTTEREDGWKAFRICGVLDFSLTGILAKISALLADCAIGIFAVSTYNTDYILVKQERFRDALDALSKAGYEIK